MKTTRLYDNGNTMAFTATVLACVPEGDRYAVTLDATAFFPGGGGQICDSGTLGGAAVLGMREAAGEIVHLTDAPLEIGAVVEGKLDVEPRRRRMQNHSGEHILSGLFHREYGLTNVGFHMGSEDVTLDLDGELSNEQLSRIELMANVIVSWNLPITVDYPDAETLAALDYRSKLDLTEDVRIVSIGEGGCTDRCACCAPHVNRTGEIGMIKVLDHIRYKGGIRIHILCGLDALDDYRAKYAAISTVAASLSVKQKDIVAAVARLGDEISAEKARQSALIGRLIELHIAALTPDSPALIIEPAFTPNDLRRAVNAALEVTSTAMAIAGDDASGYAYVLGSRVADCRELSHALHATLGGRGGGSAAMVQGRMTAKTEDIWRMWESIG